MVLYQLILEDPLRIGWFWDVSAYAGGYELWWGYNELTMM